MRASDIIVVFGIRLVSRNVLGFFFRVYVRIASVLCKPLVLAAFLSRDTGSEYGVGLISKLLLARKMIRNNRKIISASHYLEHLVMATAILRIPRSIEGCLVECGCYKGASTSNLSLVASLCRRRLEVFDSFEGLPPASERDKAHRLIEQREIHTYCAGAWRGTLEEVQTNIRKYGHIGSVTFHSGYFKDTLPSFKQPCAFVFLDVDLVESVETCLVRLWPLLQDGCYLFTHEAAHHEIASLFFDRDWWRRHLECDLPGLIGAGSGIGLIPSRNGFRSDLAFTVKRPEVLRFVEKPQTGLDGGHRSPEAPIR